MEKSKKVWQQPLATEIEVNGGATPSNNENSQHYDQNAVS